MGARPSSFRKSGGGFLNGVDGVITGYTFTDEFNGEPFKPGRDPKTGKERFHALYCVLSVRVDGADEDVTTTLFVGGADDFEVSEDGHVLSSEEGRELGAGTAFAKFITSMVEAGFPEARLPEDSIDFTSIIGTRGRFIQRANEEDTKRLGKRKDKKTGKEYARTDLVIDQVYELPADEAEAAPAPKAKGKPAAGKAAKGEDLTQLTTDTLLAILADAPNNTINRKNLATKVIMKLTKHPKREDVRGIMTSEDFLQGENGWSYDAKSGAVTLAESE